MHDDCWGMHDDRWAAQGDHNGINDDRCGPNDDGSGTHDGCCGIHAHRCGTNHGRWALHDDRVPLGLPLPVLLETINDTDKRRRGAAQERGDSRCHPPSYCSSMLRAVAFIVIVVVGLSLWTIIRSVRVPKGPFPRCRRCSYSLEGVGSERCPECGTELAGAATFRATDAGKEIPSNERLTSALVVLGIVLGLVTTGVVSSVWPWHLLRVTGSSIYTPMPDGVVSANWMSSPPRRIDVRFDLEFIRHYPVHKGTVTVEIILPDHRRVRFSCDEAGNVAAPDALGRTPNSSLGKDTTRALYRASGFDVDNDEKLACEADLVHDIVATLLRSPYAIGGATPWAITAGKRRVQLSRTGGLGILSSGKGDVIPLGKSGVPLTAVLVFVFLSLYAPLAIYLQRRRKRALEQLLSTALQAT